MTSTTVSYWIAPGGTAFTVVYVIRFALWVTTSKTSWAHPLPIFTEHCSSIQVALCYFRKRWPMLTSLSPSSTTRGQVWVSPLLSRKAIRLAAVSAALSEQGYQSVYFAACQARPLPLIGIFLFEASTPRKRGTSSDEVRQQTSTTVSTAN